MFKTLILYALGFIKNKTFFPSLFNNIFFIVLNKVKYENIVWIHLQEHIGDIVACEPVSLYAKKTYPNAKIFWITKIQYESLVKCNPNIDQVLTMTCILEWILLKKIIKKDKIIDLHIHNRRDSYFPISLTNPNSYSITLENYYSYGSILESFSLSAGIPKLNAQPIFHFCQNNTENTLEKYIVFHCSSNESIKNWDTDKWLQLLKKLTHNNYTIVEIGLSNVIKTTNSRYLNYCGKKDFQDIAKIISNAELFIGIDSGFAHFANALKIPSVILLGHYRIFKMYMPYTGFFADNINDMVIQHNGLPSQIPVDIVIQKAIKLLNNKEIN